MIEINGIAYEEIPQEQPKKMGKTLSKLMLMASFFELHDPYSPRRTASKPLPTNDIVKEFELIQLKKSSLSRSERDRVVFAFNRLYRPVANSPTSTANQHQ